MSHPRTSNSNGSGFECLAKSVARDVEAMLSDLLPPLEGARGRLIQAMRHACLGGGKRIRPFAVVNTAALFDVPRDVALRTAACIEMVHCYSLVHDDLPSLDNSDMRRGRPTVHKAFDEPTAVLAGDALLTLPFGLLIDPKTHPILAVRAELVAALAESAGINGLVGGQMIDTAPERRTLDLAGIAELQSMKTGALIRFSCGAGAILGQASKVHRTLIDTYAGEIGLAYQIADDLLDLDSSDTELGKPVGQDASKQKATFVMHLGKKEARSLARAKVNSAIGWLEVFGSRAEPLRQLARFAVERRH